MPMLNGTEVVLAAPNLAKLIIYTTINSAEQHKFLALVAISSAIISLKEIKIIICAIIIKNSKHNKVGIL